MDLTTAANDIRRARRLRARVKKLGVWMHSLGRIICKFRVSLFYSTARWGEADDTMRSYYLMALCLSRDTLEGLA